MKRILKYTLDFTGGDRMNVVMPVGSIIRHVAFQVGDIQMWAEVDDEAPATVTRTFQLYGTGSAHTGDAGEPELWMHEYIGTVLTPNGNFVFHIYETSRT